MEVEKYPRQDVTVTNVNPEIAYAFKRVCEIKKLNSGDYLTKLMEQAIRDQDEERYMDSFNHGYQNKLKQGHILVYI